jgi:hypothetical protein
VKFHGSLPDHGMWTTLRLWCFYFTHHGFFGDPRTPCPAGPFILAPPPPTSPKSAPYWCAEGATNGYNGRTSTIIDLTVLASKIVTNIDLGAGWVNEAFLPALKQALSASKLFTGITLSTPDRGKPQSTPPNPSLHTSIVLSVFRRIVTSVWGPPMICV